MAVQFAHGTGFRYSVSERVGFVRKDIPECPNRADDVMLVQYLMKKWLGHLTGTILPNSVTLLVDGYCGPVTCLGIVMTQSRQIRFDHDQIKIYGESWGVVDPVKSSAALSHTTMGYLNDFGLHNIRGGIADQGDCPPKLRAALLASAKPDPQRR